MKTDIAPAIAVNKLALERALCIESFYDFFLRFWPTISAEKLVDNWHIKYLCDELQKIAERVFKREAKEYDLVVNIPPSTTKSSICSVAFPAWVWAHDPSLRLICGSHGYDLSLELAGFCRNLVVSEKYKELFPEVELVSEGKELMRTSKGGYRVAASVGSGNVTGKHAHLHIFDDLIDAKAALSEVSLKDAKQWLTHVTPSRVVNAALTPVVLLMQRLAIGDPTDVMLERAKSGGTPVRFIRLPAEKNNDVRPRKLRAHYISGLLDPNRLSKAILKVKEAELGQYAFQGQYQQKPVMPGGGMFRVLNIKIVKQAPTHFIKVVRYVDKAGTEKGGAYTVGVKMGKTGKGVDVRYWILDVVRGQWEAGEREKVIKQTAKLDGRSVTIGIEQEPGSGGKESAQNTVRNLAGFSVRINRPISNKTARADPFATQVNAGNVSMVEAPWNAAYLQELALFWYGPYKDQVDASSGAFLMLVSGFQTGGLSVIKPGMSAGAVMAGTR